MIHLLANGPSLLRHWTGATQSGDLVVGVNTAAWVVDVDVWCYLDNEVPAGLPAGRRPPPVCATGANQPIVNGAERWVIPGYMETVEVLPAGDRPHAVTHLNYTFPCVLALVAARWQDEEVTIYGFDCAVDSADVAGKAGSCGKLRWMRELPWVRHYWLPHWKVASDLSPDVLAWVRKDLDIGLAALMDFNPRRDPTCVIHHAQVIVH